MQPWRDAMASALYGPGGYYTAGAGAAGFRTSARSPAFARALARLVATVDEALGRPEPFDLVDVGAGDGCLLAAVVAAIGEQHAGAGVASLGARLRPVAVDVAPPPRRAPAGLTWASEPPATVVGLLLAHELLDVVPIDVVEDGRLLLVDATGRERPGPPPSPADRDWLDTWWPGWQDGRAEIGRERDARWAGLVGRLDAGLAVAVDYAHTREDRPPVGTLVGYRDGRAVPPVPDGSCDLTAHVALDACAAAAARARRDADTVLSTQRPVLRWLGLRGERPPYSAGAPAAYLAALAAAADEAALLDPAGPGGFGWLVHAVGVPPPLPNHAR